MPDINRDDAPRAVLQQAIRKSSGLSADIQTQQSARINTKLAKRGFELEAPATHILRRRIVCPTNTNRRIMREGFRRLGDALLTDKDDSRHNHRLSTRARRSKTALDQQLIYPFTPHLWRYFTAKTPAWASLRQETIC